jgi:hypothetical protein
MWDWLPKADTLKAIGSIGGALGQGYSAISQNKWSKKMFNLSKSNYDNQVRKETQAQSNMDSAVASVYGKPKKKKKNNVGFNLTSGV